MSQCRGTFALSPAESDAVARLSGDWNPLHVDPLAARRLQFGGTVVHGVHTLLKVWDLAFAQLAAALPPGVARLVASFPQPATTGAPVDYRALLAPDGSRVELGAESGGRRVLALTIALSPESPTAGWPAIPDSPIPREAPLEQAFPPAESSGVLDLVWERDLAARLFPWLAAQYGAGILAPILASTRVVGMRCPGLHSVYSGLDLGLAAPVAGAGEGPARLHWSVERTEGRFRMAKLGLAAPGVQGRLDTFFRPEPVVQPDFGSVRLRVPPGRFAGQHALVVGGTRGVGEIAAKILAAGGAEVALTYRQGRGDAERVQCEIQAGGGHCRILHLDTAAPGLDAAGALAGLPPPSLCLYFASPHIAANKSRAWDSALFARFCAVYVDGFAQLVRALADGPSPGCTFYYPSSIYVCEPEKGFAEYASAKGAGEALCAQLAARWPKARFVAPRLPRMATDQTASIVPVRCDSALEVMLGELLGMALGPADRA
jgi:acyl dehydratase/NAD(P)-dependent dehydrogenase (short-subunit alcohol dehydrogenase family)